MIVSLSQGSSSYSQTNVLGDREIRIKVQDIVSLVDAQEPVSIANQSIASENDRSLVDVFGVVTAVGNGVRYYQPNDRVFFTEAVIARTKIGAHKLIDERFVGSVKDITPIQKAVLANPDINLANHILVSELGIKGAQVERGRVLLLSGSMNAVAKAIISEAKRLKLIVFVKITEQQASDQLLNLGVDLVFDENSHIEQYIQSKGYDNIDYFVCINNAEHYYSARIELNNAELLKCKLLASSAQPL